MVISHFKHIMVSQKRKLHINIHENIKVLYFSPPPPVPFSSQLRTQFLSAKLSGKMLEKSTSAIRAHFYTNALREYNKVLPSSG